MKQPINPWQTATIIGSVWGAFEIVAGSLLHNLAIPMAAGTILSALGVMIMVAGARVFGGKGIFWRSALVCAALKTVSPSAVILTPMIGITIEGLLMEVGVLLLGQNLFGFMLGGGLALLSILGFKLFRLIMIYGTDIIEAYQSVFSIVFSNEYFSQKGYLIPIAIIVTIYLAIGAFVAFTGYKGGNAIKRRFEDKNIQLIPNLDSYKPLMKHGQYKGGIGFLIFHVVWLVAFISLKNFANPYYWLSAGIIYVLLTIFRYGRIRKLLSRPTFWISILLVSFLSGLFITIGKSEVLSLNNQLFDNIFSIFIRATVVLISFSCIGIEAMSKGVSRYFKSAYFAPLSKSFAHAHGSLPSLLSELKTNYKSFYQPLPLIEGMFTQFTDIKSKVDNLPKVLIVTADKQAGKTTFLKEMIAHLEHSQIPYFGFIAEGLWDENNQRSGFNLVTLPERKEIPLCDKVTSEWLQYDPYYFNPAALSLGKNLLTNAPEGAVIFIDEIGRFELNGNLWSDALTNILNKHNNPIVISVRKIFVEEVKVKWNLTNALVIDATVDCPEDIAQLILR
jgi:nucleoside-triphosphatase THEP1